MDPNMENSLFEWCLKEIKDQKRLLTRSSIKQKARNLSQYPGTFKASKGWLDKFMKRYNYAEKAKQIFEEMKKDESKNSGKIESNELDFELPLKKEYTFHKDEIKYEEEEEIRNFDTIFLEEENKNNYD